MVSQHSVALAQLVFALLCARKAGAILTFRPFEPFIPCADGSPAGIYVEETNPKVDITESRNHVMVFIGGGSCTSPSDCAEAYEIERFKFTSTLNPDKIEGHTVLSRDPKVNDIHAHTKWLVPYCSQDLFLGDIDKGQVGGFLHAGSAIFDRALSFWEDQVLSSVPTGTGNATSSVLDTFVVVGMSAGAVAVMNKVDKIREAARNLDVKNLRLLLDSPSVMSDYELSKKDYNAAMETYVDLAEHPLCNPKNEFSLLYSSSDVSALPCCLSTHCMLRHDPRLTSFYQTEPTSVATEELMILDPAYDSFSLLVGTFDTEDSEEGKLTNKNSDDLWSMPEFASQRKTRALETVAIAAGTANTTAIHKARIKWVFTSCVTHTFLVPTLEFLFLGCKYGDYEDEKASVACRDDGFATEFEAEFAQLTFRLWRTTETWDVAELDGRSIHDIVKEFLLDTEAEEAVPSTMPVPAIDLRREECFGPNCLEEETAASVHVQPSCQSLVEIRDPFVSIPVSFQVLCTVRIVVWVIISLLIRCGGKRDRIMSLQYLHEASVNTDFTDSSTSTLPAVSTRNLSTDLTFSGITVTTTTGSCLLDNVGFDLKRGTVNAICGRSGSGKSTLLRVLSQLQQQGVSVTMAGGEPELTAMPKACLRQEDNLAAFGKIVPAEYLRLSSKIYGTTDKKFAELYHFTEQLFGRGSKSAGENEMSKLFNPFVDAKIENLSGGQKRMMSIACTLLLDPELLLLDEPLSGLDSVSSLEVMEALHLVAERHRCTIIMIVHQPSEAILEHFNQLVVLRAGKVVYDCGIKENGTEMASFMLNKHLFQSADAFQEKPSKSSLRPSLSAVKEHSSRAFILESMARIDPEEFFSAGGSSRNILESNEFVVEEKEPESEDTEDGNMHNRSGRTADQSNAPARRLSFNDWRSGGDVYAMDVHATGRNAWASSLNLDTVSKEDAPEPYDDTKETSSDSNVEHSETGEASSKQVVDYLPLAIKQVQPIALRTHQQYGWGWVDILTVTCAVGLVALILQFEKSFAAQVVFMTLVMVALPVILFTHRILEYSDMWLAHRLEMDDKKISLLAFQLTTATITFPVPIIAVFVAIVPVYGILGWSFKTFLVQVLFSVIHLLIPIQLGRLLSLFFHGQFSKLVKLYTILLFLNFLLSSVPVASRKFPEGLRWLFALSIDFWAISGAVMNQFDNENYSNDDSCFDFLTCLVSDGSFIVHFFGFAPMSNQFLAMGVLTVCFIILVGLEYLLLRRRCAGVSLCGSDPPTSKKKNRALGPKGHSAFLGKSLTGSLRSWKSIGGSFRFRVSQLQRRSRTMSLFGGSRYMSESQKEHQIADDSASMDTDSFWA